MSDTELEVTRMFKANNVVAESDLWLQFQIREILRHAPDVSARQKIRILTAERETLLEENLDAAVQASTSTTPNN